MHQTVKKVVPFARTKKRNCNNMFYNVERMSSGGLNATTFRLTTKIENRTELKY